MASGERTILFSLSTSAVFRNLFFFPGSVFERLKEKLSSGSQIRVVFLLPAAHKNKYPEFIEACRKFRNFEVEFGEAPLKKTLAQKLFYFFYSYLIYTGTTWIMATIGTRPDEPPAGGRWYLAPVKSFIANTFGRVKLVKALVPKLHLYFFSERPFKEIFDQHRPELVFIPHLYGWFDTLVLAEAKRRGLKSLGMAAGWDHLDKYFLPFQVDRLLAQSEQIKTAAIKFQSYLPEKINLVGWPHFDFIHDPRYIVSRQEILKSLDFPRDSKFVLYVSNSSYSPDEPEVIETMLDWMEKGRFGSDVYLVIRPYSGGRSQDREFDKKKFLRFEAHPRVRFYKREFWGDLERSIYFVNIMREADAVIAVYTTMALEAAVLDRPLVATAFDGNQSRPLARSIRRFEEFEHFKDVLRIGAMKTTRNFEELFSALDSYLENPGLEREKREIMRQELCYKIDGKSSERIANHIFNETGVA